MTQWRGSLLPFIVASSLQLSSSRLGSAQLSSARLSSARLSSAQLSSAQLGSALLSSASNYLSASTYLPSFLSAQDEKQTKGSGGWENFQVARLVGCCARVLCSCTSWRSGSTRISLRHPPSQPLDLYARVRAHSLAADDLVTYLVANGRPPVSTADLSLLVVPVCGSVWCCHRPILQSPRRELLQDGLTGHVCGHF